MSGRVVAGGSSVPGGRGRVAFIFVVASVVLTTLMLAAAGCGTAGGLGGGSTTTISAGGPTTTILSGSISHPTGNSEVVLQASEGGGFVPVQYNYTMIPEFSLYGDGRVIVSGPVIAIYPGPALPNLQNAIIPEEAVQAILSAAREAGLLSGGFDYGRPGISDMATTTFVVNAAGTSYRTEVYALGSESGAPGLTMDQQQARAALQDFRSKLMDLTAFVSGDLAWAPYEYSALAVYSQAVDPTVSTDSTDIMPGRLDWPLANLGTAGEAVAQGFRRVVVSGADLAKLQPVLAKATAITLWKSGGSEYNLFFRPLLPDEAA